MTRRTQITVTRGCLTGTGRTKTLAKADLERQITQALGDHHPHVECRFDHVLIALATPQGWQSMLLSPDQIRRADNGCFTQYGFAESREAVIQSLRLHAAQSAWRPSTDDDAHITAAGLNASRRDDLRRWIRFQRRYAAAKAAGKSDREAYAIATDPHTRDLDPS